MIQQVLMPYHLFCSFSWGLRHDTIVWQLSPEEVSAKQLESQTVHKVELSSEKLSVTMNIFFNLEIDILKMLHH